jgi:hypothetical protein
MTTPSTPSTHPFGAAARRVSRAATRPQTPAGRAAAASIRSAFGGAAGPGARVAAQNFLLSNLGFFAQHHKGVDYDELLRVKTAEPALLMNKLLRSSGLNIKKFLQIKPFEIAALVPKIRLFLVYSGNDTSKRDKIIELKFQDKTNSDIGDITENIVGRGQGVGVRSFSIETQGTNPAEGALVRCDLEIFFENIEMLAKQSNQEDPSHYDYIELILRRTRNPSKKIDSKGNEIPYSRITNRFGFRLMASVGWAIPTGNLISPELKRVLRESQDLIYLHLVNHEIKFNQDGTGTLLCDYQGAIENALTDKVYDILSVPEENARYKETKRLEASLERTETAGRQIDEDDRRALDRNQKSIQKIKEELQKLKNPLRAQKYARIINGLYQPRSGPSRINTVDLTQDELRALKGGLYHGSAPPITADRVSPAAMATAARLAAPMGGTAKFAVDPKDPKPKPDLATRLTFIYFGDLIEVVLDIVRENFKQKGEPIKPGHDDFKVLLGPLTYKEKNGDEFKTRTINLADVPISLKSFEFWFEKNIRRRGLDSFSFRSFLKSATSELVLAALGEYMDFDEKIKIRNRVGIQTFLGQPLSGNTKRIDLDAGDSGLNLIRSAAGRADFTNMQPYIVLFASIEVPNSRDPSNIDADMRDGIYHFHLGADRGILKAINFNKTDIPYNREGRLTSQDAQEGQLRDKYDASIDLVGSSFLFRPGQKLYINPTLAGFGNIGSARSVSRMLGLGGYYDIIKVTSNLNRSDGYTTNLECAWVGFGKGDDVSAPVGMSNPEAAPSIEGSPTPPPAVPSEELLPDPPSYEPDPAGRPLSERMDDPPAEDADGFVDTGAGSPPVEIEQEIIRFPRPLGAGGFVE